MAALCVRWGADPTDEAAAARGREMSRVSLGDNGAMAAVMGLEPEAIRTVHAGGALIEPSVARKMVAEFARLPSAGSVETDLIDRSRASVFEVGREGVAVLGFEEGREVAMAREHPADREAVAEHHLRTRERSADAGDARAHLAAADRSLQVGALEPFLG